WAAWPRTRPRAASSASSRPTWRGSCSDGRQWAEPRSHPGVRAAEPLLRALGAAGDPRRRARPPDPIPAPPLPAAGPGAAAPDRGRSAAWRPPRPHRRAHARRPPPLLAGLRRQQRDEPLRPDRRAGPALARAAAAEDGRLALRAARRHRPAVARPRRGLAGPGLD